MQSRPNLLLHTLVLIATILGGAGRVAAQATGGPTFFAPQRAFGSTELGLTASRPGPNAFALEGRYGVALNRSSLSMRAGYLDYGGPGDGRFAAGAELRLPVLGRSPTFPLDGSFIAGVGVIFESNDGQTVVPLGLSIGRRLTVDEGALHITPYVQPTVIFMDGARVVLGLGVDVRLGGLPEVRVNWATGDMDGFSVSLFWSR